jgi:acyl carrier protein
MQPAGPKGFTSAARQSSMSDQDKVFQEIKSIIADKLSISADEIQLGSSFIDDLGADSLDLADLVMAIEEQYEIDFSNEDTDKFRTVGDVVNVILEQKK